MSQQNPLGVNPQVLALAIARMAEGVGNSFLVIVIPLFIGSSNVGGQTFGLTELFITGLVLSLFGFVNSPLQPYVGRLSDRLGRRKIFVVLGLGLLAASNFAYTFATAYWHLVVIRVIQGLAGALIIPTTVALVNDLATDANRGGNMGTYNTFILAGFGVGPIIAGGVVGAGPYMLPTGIEISGYEAAFYFATLTAMLALGLVLLTIRDPPIDPDPDGRGILGAVSIFDREGTQLLNPIFALGAVTFIMAVGIGIFATLGEVVNDLLTQDPAMFGIQFAAFVLAQVVLQAPVGRATDYYGRKVFLIVGTVLLVPTTLAQGFVPDVSPGILFISDSWLMVLARFLQGVAGAMVFAPAMALAGDMAREGESGVVLSVLTLGFSLGVAVGPLFSGILAEWGFAVPFVFAAGLAIVSVFLILTQVHEVRPPNRALPFVGHVT